MLYTGSDIKDALADATVKVVDHDWGAGSGVPVFVAEEVLIAGGRMHARVAVGAVPDISGGKMQFLG